YSLEKFSYNKVARTRDHPFWEMQEGTASQIFCIDNQIELTFVCNADGLHKHPKVTRSDIRGWIARSGVGGRQLRLAVRVEGWELESRFGWAGT
ncbi:hypothetical protein HAX54_019415, partial [Datura stramonium]|nr:hypothetical protein [Datura stramonium]